MLNFKIIVKFPWKAVYLCYGYLYSAVDRLNQITILSLDRTKKKCVQNRKRIFQYRRFFLENDDSVVFKVTPFSISIIFQYSEMPFMGDGQSGKVGVSECWRFYAVSTARVIFTAKTSLDLFSLSREQVWTFSSLG